MNRKTIVLTQFDATVQLLQVDLLTLERKLIPAAKIDSSKICFGFFEIESESPTLNTVALFATPEGPVMLLNDRLYPLSLGKTKIKISDEGKHTHFRVFHENQHIFGMFMEPKFGIGLHPYSNEREDIDFYYWLSTKVGNPDFYSTYTREIVYCDLDDE
ncbi:hypothetical protein E2K99_22300 [Herbaspirillum huttiense]|uniref:hypothetical protein n=1 Tax=Herbaspirillum huttiense TaxID=863372 RepID=UPI001065C2DF|nr:hypothetical protein [Herbaspirillum huttiense]QBP77553.1 hypothetical protein E2K99_22300 [Herbaspirillum huttiense]